MPQDSRSTNDLTPNMFQREPSIAINPNDPNNVVIAAVDYRDDVLDLSGTPIPWIYVYFTFDAAATSPQWGNVRLPGTALGRFELAADPSVAFDKANRFYIAGLAGNGTRAIFVARYTVVYSPLPTISHDRTVIVDEEPTSGMSARLLDKPFMAVDPSSKPDPSVYVAYTDLKAAGGPAMFFARSTNAGSTFGNRIILDQGTAIWGDFVNPAPVPTVGIDGKVYVAYFAGKSEIRIVKSSDGGKTFSPQTRAVSVVLRDSAGLQRFAALEIIPILSLGASRVNAPELYLVWDDFRHASIGLGNDILFSYSIDEGTTWSSPSRVNDDSGSADQFFPWLAPAGRLSNDKDVSVIFYDTRVDSSRITVFYARSTNLGASWQTNLQLADMVFDPVGLIPNCDPFPDRQCKFIGDYIGATAFTGADDTVSVWVAWTDTRDRNPATSAGSDIYADRLTYVIPRGGGGGGCGCHQTGPQP